MNMRSSSSASLVRGLCLPFLAAGLLGLASGCVSKGGNARSEAPDLPESGPRSELLLLNVPEASGWVAYTCDPSDHVEMEDYRIVVIQQSSGNIIYDSQIPLAADLCTHGFEMAPEDPRLSRLAHNVDRDIIEPLETYQRRLTEEAEQGETSPEEDSAAPSSDDEAAESPAVEPKTESENKVETSPSALETGDALPQTPEAEEERPLRIVERGDGVLTIEQQTAGLLSVGDRLFLREAPRVIVLPGTGERIEVSEGEVLGLAEVTSISDLRGEAKLLSGEVPENGYPEKTDSP